MYKNSYGKVFLAGSAHLDVLAHVTGDDDVIDKIGRVVIEIGGTGCNMATNLASLGLEPVLMTSMQEDSPYCGIIITHLRAHGVQVSLIDDSSMPAAVFSAHIGRNGEMISAVSAMPVENAVFPVDTVRHAMRDARCVILECNLSGFTLNVLAQVASELGLPVFVGGVSEEKSLRIASIMAPLAGVFMNLRECAYFGRNVIGSESHQEIAARLRCPLIVSVGREGVVLIENGVASHIDPSRIDETINTLGAGDALMSATIAHHVFGGMTLTQAIEKGVNFASGIISKSNCSAAKGHAIETALNALDRLATRDTMTGLSNRRAGEQTLSDAHSSSIAGASPYSVLMIDIDFFKRVNDVFGHDVGDDVIKAVAAILIKAVRDVDVACRWGGEEFLCILKESDENMAILIAERIRETVYVTEMARVGKITVSIGAATWVGTEPNSLFQDIVKLADMGLYEAKQLGRNRVCVGRISPQVGHELSVA